MRDRDKPFIVYRGGMSPFRLVPRGIKGWAQFGVWMGVLVPAVAWLAEHLDTRHINADFGAGILLFCIGMIIWLVAGLWWMHAHAEVVNVVEVERQRQWDRRKLERERERELQRADDLETEHRG